MAKNLRNEDEFNVFFEKNMYNIKKFMKHHPGGTNTLLGKENVDVTYSMKAYKHSDFAYYLLSQYKTDGSQMKNALNLDINGNALNGKVKYDEEKRKHIENMETIENLVDWSQPMLSQIHKLGPHYAEWVHSPVDKELRLFSSSFLERFTYTPWYWVPIFWIPIIVFGTYYTYTNSVLCSDKCSHSPMPSSKYFNSFVFGIILWTLLEYSIHRWIFHYKPGNAVFWKQLHFLIHGLHHKVPFDELRLVFPPIPGLFIVFILYSILSQILPNTEIIVFGSLTGYLIYDMIHYFIHNSSPKDGSILYTLKRYHASHHFKEPLQGFGISSKLWDVVFDTTIQMRKLDFSLSWK